MKKVLFILVLMMSVLVINAQTTKTTETKEQSIHTTIKAGDLPKAITDNIAKDYAGFTIKEASTVTKNNVMTYHVVIVNNTIKETVVYDKDGKFVKMYHQKDVTQNSSKKK
ncbi:MAG: hypothetical protein WA816_06960 [Bacteroidales bacterium]